MTHNECTDGTLEWLTCADTALLDEPDRDGLRERNFWWIVTNADGTRYIAFQDVRAEEPVYDPFYQDRTDLEWV